MAVIDLARYIPSRALVDGRLADVLTPERAWYDQLVAADSDELLNRWNVKVHQDLNSPTTAEDCWTWTAGTNPGGYGTFKVNGGSVLAHHVLWAVEHGSPPHYVHGLHGWERVDVSHVCHDRDASCAGGLTCKHRRCVNPEHLSLMSHSANVRSGRGGEHLRSRTECPSGHSYAEHGFPYTDPAGVTRRYCRACKSGGRAVEFIGARKAAPELAVAVAA